VTKKSKNGRQSISVTFSQIKCRCGAMRVRAVACPDCGRGADWFEVDVENQRRGRVVGTCLEALELAAAAEPDVAGLERPVEHLGQFLELAEMPSRFVDAMQSLEKAGQGSPAELVEACAAAGRLARRLSLSPRRRPWIRTDDVAQSAADALLDMMRKFLEAFAAPTPLLAQSNAETARQSLNSVVVRVEELNRLRERWESIEEADDVGDWMAEALADAADARGTTGFIDLELAGRGLYREITGRMPGEGAGLGLLMSDLFAQYVGDENAFKDAIAAADQFMATVAPKLNDAIARPTVADEMRNGFVQLADQVQLTNAAIAAALNDRQAVRSALNLMHTVFEGPARRMVALMLDLAGVGRFEEYLPADGARTIREARGLPAIGPTVYGFDAALRIAQAHQSYEFKEDHLILRMRKKGAPEGQVVRISLDDLLDRALASIECVNALALVIQVHASEQGLDLIGEETLAALGVGPPQYGAALLRAAGYDEIEFDGPRVSLSGPKLTGAAVIAISLALPDDQVATVSLETEGSLTEYEIDIALMRENSSIPEGLDKEFHMQRTLSRVLVNGESGWSAPSMQRWVVRRALLIAQSKDSGRDDFVQIMREMRQLLNFATEQSLPVAGEIRGLMRLLRLSFEGRTSELDSSVFDRLGGFLADDIPVVLPFEFDSNDK
jgi:hypothetical protein